MYRELRFKTILNEEDVGGSYNSGWMPPTTARAKLDEQTLALINENKWTEAFATTRNQEQRNAEIDLFVDTALKQYKNNLVPAVDIVRSLIQQLGFKETENPYIKFIKLFFGKNPSIQITREGWIALNDFLANDIITESALYGTGHDGNKHLIFNPYLYTTDEFKSSSKNMLQVMKDYEYLSKEDNIANLNMNAIINTPDNPYKKKLNALNLAFDGSGKVVSTQMNGELAKKIRNIFIYRDPNNELGELSSLQTLYWINKAIALGDKLSQGTQKMGKEEEINMFLNNIQNSTYSKEQLQAVFNYLAKLGYRATT